jgi:hypothetical protein
MEVEGIPPDGWSFIPEAELGDDPWATVNERAAKWRPEMTHYRLTDLTGEHAREGWEPGLWLEVWRERPQREAPFDPPLTAHGPLRPRRA